MPDISVQYVPQAASHAESYRHPELHAMAQVQHTLCSRFMKYIRPVYTKHSRHQAVFGQCIVCCINMHVYKSGILCSQAQEKHTSSVLTISWTRLSVTQLAVFELCLCPAWLLPSRSRLPPAPLQL